MAAKRNKGEEEVTVEGRVRSAEVLSGVEGRSGEGMVKNVCRGLRVSEAKRFSFVPGSLGQ